MTESNFVRHEPCPKCGSSDAYSVYDDGQVIVLVVIHTPMENKPRENDGFGNINQDMMVKQFTEEVEET